MSMLLMVKAMNARVGNPLRKLVLIKLADNANDKGECWPSYQHIADQCEISKRSVMSHVKELESVGLLKIDRRKGPKGNSSNLFTLTIPSEFTAPHGANAAPPSESPAPAPSESPAPRTSHSSESVKEPVTHNAPAGAEKSGCFICDGEQPGCATCKPDQPPATEKPKTGNSALDDAFEAFWTAGMRKVNKKKARSMFGAQFKLAKPKLEGDDKERQFAGYLIADIKKRLNSDQLGFDQMHPTTYLNNQRWKDEYAKAEQKAREGLQPENQGVDEAIYTRAAEVTPQQRQEASGKLTEVMKGLDL